MQLDDIDLKNLIDDNKYGFIITDSLIGIHCLEQCIIMPSLLDKYLDENSDKDDVYWIQRNVHQQIELLILQKCSDKRLLFKPSR